MRYLSDLPTFFTTFLKTDMDWTTRRGLLRSVLIYYGVPGRRRQLAKFYSQFIEPDDLAFDIGAHVGNRLQAWLDIGATVVAVEPQPACMALLRRWYGDNSNALLVDAAVGAQPGELPIYISRRTPTVTTLSAEWQQAVQKVDSFSTVQWDQQKIVAVTTLDELIERFGLPVFCKIDVEGYEYEVLRGLSQPIRTLSFEYVPAALATSLDCIKRISQLGNYSFNWSPGERHQLQQDAWLTAAQMTELLTSMRPDDDSGDVYARRVNPA